MRVLYVIDSLVPSGAERSLAAMAPEYARRGVALDVAYLRDRPGLQRQLEDGGAELFCIAGRGGRAGWVVRLRALMRRRAPDLVHTTLPEADIAGRIAARLAGVPAVCSIVNLRYGAEQLAGRSVAAWKVQLVRRVDAATARSVVRFHAITSYIARAMGSVLGIPLDRIDVVPRGRDAAALGVRTPERRDAARRKLGVDARTPLVLCAARQDRQKGLDVAIEALVQVRAEIPDARMVVAGRGGNATAELRAAVARLGLGEAVEFLGVRQDVPELLCAADVFLLPSRWEGLGSVLLEAMALEAPIVASEIPPVQEVLGSGDTALWVPPGGASQLAVAILATLRNAEAATTRARASRLRFLERFTIDRVTDQMVAFYQRALSR